MIEPKTYYYGAECSNIHLLLQVGAICVQYSQDDILVPQS